MITIASLHFSSLLFLSLLFSSLLDFGIWNCELEEIEITDFITNRKRRESTNGPE
jgi:hypothetical protein